MSLGGNRIQPGVLWRFGLCPRLLPEQDIPTCNLNRAYTDIVVWPNLLKVQSYR